MKAELSRAGMAEAERFELSSPCGLPDFESFPLLCDTGFWTELSGSFVRAKSRIIAGLLMRKSGKCLILQQSSNKLIFAILGRTDPLQDRTPGRTGQAKTTVAIHIGSL